MDNYKALFIYPDYYQSTTATRRVLISSRKFFSKMTFAYWARQGYVIDPKDNIFDGIEMSVFLKSAPPRSFQVLLLFVKFQFWVLKNIFKTKPDFISAFTFYTIIPSLFYKYFFNWKCRVVYDPRDYVSVCYRINKIIEWCLNVMDNICIKLSDLTIFPDNQYFGYYGRFRLKADRYFILPNSTEDSWSLVRPQDTHEKYNIPKDQSIIPFIGYFSETRGRDLIYEIIRQKPEGFHFVIAGDFRSQDDIDFFNNQDNVSFLGRITYLEALAIMRDSLVVPLLYDPVSLNNKYAFPTKYYDSLMVGTPVIVSYGQVDVYDAIKKYDIGYAIEYNDVEAFGKLLFNLKENQHTIDRKRIRELFLSDYDYNLFRDRLSAVYKNLLERKSNF
jgi:glycosyltransferase involved in cell wall biosynthesis